MLRTITGQYTRSATQKVSAVSTNLRTGSTGEYVRHESGHRHWVGRGTDYEPEAGRYHLHVALACPWACGVLSMLFIKGLEDAISYSIVHPVWGKTKPDDLQDEHFGWVYREPCDAPMTNPLGHGSFPCDEALIADSATRAKTIREVYEKAGDPHGPFTTPVLWDKHTQTIVSNESMDILRMLNSAFNHLSKSPKVRWPTPFSRHTLHLITRRASAVCAD